MATIYEFFLRSGRLLINPVSGDRTYQRPKRNSYSGDLRRISGDFATVGNDLKSVAKKKLASNGK